MILVDKALGISSEPGRDTKWESVELLTDYLTTCNCPANTVAESNKYWHKTACIFVNYPANVVGIAIAVNQGALSEGETQNRASLALQARLGNQIRQIMKNFKKPSQISSLRSLSQVTEVFRLKEYLSNSLSQCISLHKDVAED